MKRISILIGILIFPFSVQAQKKKGQISTRQFWLSEMDKVAGPVMSNLAEDQLKLNMPDDVSKFIDNKDYRKTVAYLEAFARTLSGIAPWLNLKGGNAEEQALRNQYIQWSLKGIDNATNPAAKDYMVWKGGQPLVDASFFALAFIRCPLLWEQLDERVKKQVVAVLSSTRETVPVYSNWLLFTGMIEAFFFKFDLPYDPVRIDFGVKEFMNHWYVGDGLFSDGMDFHMDYYNSFVIQPYLATIIDVVNSKNKKYANDAVKLGKINKRYAEIQERVINADGSFPATGRSIVYRGAAFQHLANMALTRQLPASLKPAQVREALTAVIRKTLTAPGTYNKGWLTIGLYGAQPGLADFYNTTGSLYICSSIFLPLGLPEEDEFWSAAPEPWSAVKIWGGQDAKGDHALDLK